MAQAQERLPREIVFEAVQSTHDLDTDLDGNVLVGFALVAEWMDSDGERWLARLAGGPEQGLPGWQSRGYFHEALRDDWPEPADGDAEDD